ncbi:MAG TPA: MarR family transcriptional regulator [Verrucomicrobiae bacterium]|nr:MarR family transcriptional regulator [Verrucomicrobiae bacterium]
MHADRNRTTDLQYQALAELRYTLRKFLRFSENAARAAGITPQQHQAMLAIKGFGKHGSMNIGDLAERLQILHHSAVGLVDRLVAEKYLRRMHDEKDRRHVHLVLTARGEAILEKLSATHREQLHQLGPQIRLLMESLQSEGRPKN